MYAINFNHDWAYRHLDSDEGFTPVTIPHDAMLGEKRHALAFNGPNGGWFEGRDYEYVKHFIPDNALLGKSMILEFEGVYHNAEVWLNGKQLGFRPYGYTNFYVDITNSIEWGESNELRVIARNADQPNSRWYSGAGIYRPVSLWAGPQEHIVPDGIGVRTLEEHGEGGSARLEFTVTTTASGKVVVDIPSLGIQQSFIQESKTGFFVVEVPSATLWSPANPVLHSCDVRFISDTGDEDTASVNFGIRSLTWGDDGLLINGERVILQGACLHHDNGILGACAYADAEERKVLLMRNNGYNAIRSAHNPCSKAMLDACDRLGMLMMDEYIDHWYIHKTQHDYVEHFDQWWREDLKDMVNKDRNHPSVIMYSTGNEVSETAQGRGIALAQEMTDWLHELDPSRPVTCGVNIFFNFLSSIGLGQYSDKKAARELEQAQQRKDAGEVPEKHRAVGSEFYNNMAGLLGADFMKTGATLPFCDWVTKDAFAAMDVAGYNYGIKRYRRDLKAYPHRLIVGSETFCSDAYKFRELAKKNPRLIGDFVWAGMDYMGEVGVGAWEYEDYADLNIGFGWLTAGSGRLDLTGRPLGEAYYTRVALEQDAGPFIAVRPVNHTGGKHSSSAWKMSNAIDSWSWEGCEGKKAQVEVYARAASVALVVNGREVGHKRMKHDCVARFSCTYETGVIEAIAYDSKGKEIGRANLVSAKKETRLLAELEYAKDGRVMPGRIVFVRVRYADDEGVTKPLKRGIVHMNVDSGKLLGFGCAAPYNKGGFLSGETDTYYGEALAAIQIDDNAAGSFVKVEVTDGGLSDVLEIPVFGD